jgi:TMEM175 potassium channel family protein
VTDGAVPTTERHRDFDRVLTFVDAIVAIAITLLVLPLVELAPELRDGGSVGSLLRDHADELWAFALSFYVIARIWLSQHHAVAPLTTGNDRVTLLLVAWTFTIVVLPFPTSLVASAGGQAPTKVLYVGTMALSILIIATLRGQVRRHPELAGGPGTADDPAYAGPLGGVVTAGLLLLALAVMLAVPATSYFPILVLLVEAPVQRAVESLRRR